MIKTSIVKVIKECGNEERLKEVSVLGRRLKEVIQGGASSHEFIELEEASENHL